MDGTDGFTCVHVCTIVCARVRDPACGRVTLIIIIIIISLFQEDNIFGTNASLTYGPRLQR